MTNANGPLRGIRVIELGQMGAGPFCGRLLADFGAEVIKIEQPGGDAVRGFGYRVGGKSLNAATVMRNKRLVCIDLKAEEGRGIVKKLVKMSDVVVENFRPGTLEGWRLGYDELKRINPRLIMTRVSGFGQTGPYRRRPGFGVVAEAISGLRHLTGDPDRPPARVAIPLTDFLAGLYGAFGTLLAVVQRNATGEGQCVDVALYEAAFSFLHQLVPAFEKLGIVPNRTGSRLPGMTPNNLYPTKDGRFICIAAGNQSVFKRLARVMNRSDLAEDRKFRTQVARAEHENELDRIISDWTRTRTVAELESRLVANDVVASRIYDIDDIFHDEHFRNREMLISVPDDQLGAITLAGVVPKLSATPGKILRSGGVVGQDNESVLIDLLGFSRESLDDLKRRGIVGDQDSVTNPAERSQAVIHPARTAAAGRRAHRRRRLSPGS